MSEDPIGFLGGDNNFYRYVKNRPMSNKDPWGKWIVTVCRIAWNAIRPSPIGKDVVPDYGEPGSGVIPLPSDPLENILPPLNIQIPYLWDI